MFNVMFYIDVDCMLFDVCFVELFVDCVEFCMVVFQVEVWNVYVIYVVVWYGCGYLVYVEIQYCEVLCCLFVVMSVFMEVLDCVIVCCMGLMVCICCFGYVVLNFYV